MRTIVAIVGRPNAGKSTLFNRMVRTSMQAKPLAITESTPGVTRDRNYGEAEWEGKRFIVVDTGGFFAEETLQEDKGISMQVRQQALYAIDEADLIIHLLDGKEGMTPADSELAGILRRSGKKILWVANKIDAPDKEYRITEFYSIGADILPVSAAEGYGFDELMDRIIEECRIHDEEFREQAEIPNIAVVGRPNVGKSTLINSLLGKERLIVSPVPGTTRDTIDSICTYYGKKYLLIDTAGIRRKGKSYPIERFAVVRAIRSIERADVVLIVLDASYGIVDQDQKIAGIVEESGKGAIFLLNKWDVVKEPEAEYKRLREELKRKMWFMDYVPFITTSGLDRRRITTIFPLVDEIIAERRKRIPTAELNRFLSNVTSARVFPLYRGKELKFFYMTQVAVEPPAFTIFVNYPAGVKEQHIRYIEKSLRDRYSFKGTPVRIYVKSR